MEEEANRFAASFLIPDEAYRHLVRQGDFACDRLRQFAVKIGVSPGIVVGRLQHDGHIPYDRCNSLKKRVSLGA